MQRSFQFGSSCLAFGGVLALVSAMGTGRFVYTPILPAMEAALGLTKTQAGLIAAANFAGYLAGAVAAMLPALTGIGRAGLGVALAVGAATLAGMGMTESLPAFMALRFVSGVCSAVVLVGGSALITGAILRRGGGEFWSALMFGGVGAGIVLSAVLVDGLEADGIGWRGLWFGSAALAAVAGAAALLLIGPTPGQRAAHRQGRLAPGIGLLAASYGLFGFGYVITATFLVSVIRATGQPGLDFWVWPVVGLAATPSVLAWAWVARRIGVIATYAVACLTQAIGIAAAGMWAGGIGSLTGAALLGSTLTGLTALGFAAGRELAPDGAQQVAALITVVFGLGQILGPVAGGYLLDHTGGFVAPSAMGAAALLLAALLSLVLSWRVRQATR